MQSKETSFHLVCLHSLPNGCQIIDNKGINKVLEVNLERNPTFCCVCQSLEGQGADESLSLCSSVPDLGELLQCPLGNKDPRCFHYWKTPGLGTHHSGGTRPNL